MKRNFRRRGFDFAARRTGRFERRRRRSILCAALEQRDLVGLESELAGENDLVFRRFLVDGTIF